mmetsp:Transcript_21068/g.50805  ORF Transcript_21068/g.50805 Transcript_21068/m.50805 type:complete len:287 (+) Transcript_21068:744-1604(+)
MLVLLQHHHPAAPGDDETVARLVEGARGGLRRGVVLGGEGAHAVEHGRVLPADVLARPRHRKVHLAELDLLHRDADAVRARGARRGDREGRALHLEGRGEPRGDSRPHRARHAVRPDLVRPAGGLRPHRVHGLHDVSARRRSVPNDRRAPGVVLVVLRLQPGVLKRVVEGHVGVFRAAAHEAEGLARDKRLEVGVGELRPAAHVRLHAEVGKLGAEADARLGVVERVGHVLKGVAQARSDAHARDDDALQAGDLHRQLHGPGGPAGLGGDDILGRKRRAEPTLGGE